MNLLRFFPESLKEHVRRRAGVVTASARLENLRRAGFNPAQIIDAGAHRGAWTRQALKIFPAASVLMIEPQPELAAGLRALSAEFPRVRFEPVALGATAGHCRFLLEDTNSRVVPETLILGPDQIATQVAMEPLSAVAFRTGFDECGLLKLDLQGHELSALAGAGELFGHVEVILTEVSWLRLGNVPLAAEVIATCAARGYRLYDVFGFNYRPLDRALWQTDFIFVREDSHLLASTDWS